MSTLLVSFTDYASHSMRGWLIANVGPATPLETVGWSHGRGWRVAPKLGEVNCVSITFEHDEDAMMFKLAFCDQLRKSTNESDD